jgi:hypothetical protein
MGEIECNYFPVDFQFFYRQRQTARRRGNLDSTASVKEVTQGCNVGG